MPLDSASRQGGCFNPPWATSVYALPAPAAKTNPDAKRIDSDQQDDMPSSKNLGSSVPERR